MRILRTIDNEIEINQFKYIGDGLVASYTKQNENLKIWNIKNGSLIRDLKGAGRIRSTLQGKRMITVSRQPTSRIITWSLDTFETKSIESACACLFRFIELENGMIASMYLDSKVTLYQISGLDLVMVKTIQTSVHGSEIRCLEALKGEFFASASNNVILIWSCSQSEPIRTIRGHLSGVMCTKYIKDRNVLITSFKDKMIYFWNFETGEKVE